MIDTNNFIKKIDELVFHLDDIEGKKFFSQLGKEEIQSIPQNQGVYVAFKVLQFLIIPFLSFEKINELFRNDLPIGLAIDDLDLRERLTKRLIDEDLTDRDKYKTDLKMALADSKTTITNTVVTKDDRRLNSISDWIKDYNLNTSKAKEDPLRDAQYFYQQPHFTKLDEKEKNILQKLIALYKYLSTSSLSPDGFEDDLLITTEDGRLITTNRGRVVELHNFKSTNASGLRSVRGVPLSKSIGPEENRKIKELQDIAEQFAPGSLERRAVEEEMKKLGF